MFKLIKPALAKDVVGKFTPPASVVTQTSDIGPKFISTIIKLIMAIGGIYALIQMLLGGFAIITASGKQEKLQKAQQQIYNSLIGLLVMVAVFIIVAIISKLLFGSFTAILNPQLQTVN